MARYFFDVQDGEPSTDDEGVEFPDAQRAGEAALRSLPEMAKDDLRDNGIGEVAITVRDERGQPLYKATLTINAQWLADASSSRS